MKLGRVDDTPATDVSPGPLSADGWRRRISLKGRGSGVLKLVMVALVLTAAAWALYADLQVGRPAMDMNIRVTSAGTPFPGTSAPVERGAIAGAVVYTGSVAPFNEEDIYPRVTGRIVEMAVYPGDAVPGQVVARLDGVELSSKVGEANDLPVERGALVIRVDEGGPAATAGIESGDILTAVGGTSIRDLHHLHDELSLHRIGETVDVTVWRSGRRVPLRPVLEAES